MNEKLENVTAVVKANVYYDGKVVSHTVFMPNGDRKTIGIFLPGEYDFGVGDSEIMEITEGVCQVKMPGSDDWTDFAAGGTFTLPPDCRYGFRCYVPVQYLCSYIKR